MDGEIIRLIMPNADVPGCCEAREVLAHTVYNQSVEITGKVHYAIDEFFKNCPVVGHYVSPRNYGFPFVC